MASQKSTANAMEIDRLATQLAKDPHSKAFLPLAEAYCKVGMWEEAVSVLEHGLKHYPGFITAMVVLGRAYDQLKRPTMARAVLEGAVKLSPDNLRAHRTLIKIYAAQGLTQDALKSCGVILSLHPRDEEAMSIQASLQAQEGQEATDMASLPHDSTLANEPQPSPVLETDNSSSTQVTSVSQLHTASHVEPVTAHAATVAVLESWLRSIERQRRDRPTSGLRGPNP
jgi:tetratricopeptide (TPR) repeat protein